MAAKAPDPQYWRAIEDMKVWGIDDPSDSANYNEGDVGRIVLSIQRYGFNQSPRLWKDDRIRAGNHSVLALRLIKAGGQTGGHPYPPRRVIEYEGKWYVRYVDISEMSATESLGFAIADNRTAALASQDESLLAQYLRAIREDDVTVFEATGYEEEDLRLLNIMTHAEMFNPNDEWVGMPEFEQDGIKPFHSLILHFKTEQNMKDFSSLVQQVINPTTKYLYYPKLQHDHEKDFLVINNE